MRASLALLPLLSLACSDYEFHGEKDEEVFAPNIVVNPDQLTYGGVPENESRTKSFTITNMGNANLQVQDLRIDEMDVPGTFTFVTPDAQMGDMEPGEEREVEVIFTALAEEASAVAVVVSDDPNTPEATVDLLAGSEYGELALTPDPYEFGTVIVGDVGSGQIVVSNLGAAPVTISAITTSGGAGVFDAWNDDLPLTLGAGEESFISVTFTPVDETAYTADLVVTHDGPDGTNTSVLTGNGDVGEPPPGTPVAECSVSPNKVEPLTFPVTWFGSGADAPAGHAIIDYEWALITQPSGSAISMPLGGADRSGMVPDLAGTYQGQLIVTNDQGVRSEPCVATLEVIPSENLWIEMFWTHSGDDMDLHLLRPGGSPRSSGDCYYANCARTGLEWGGAGSADNPILDLDDIPGTGPENINIEDPYDGTYTVFVHDYPGSVYNSSNDVTIKIYLGGVLQWEDTRAISGEDDDEYFAEINWSGGSATVTDLGGGGGGWP